MCHQSIHNLSTFYQHSINMLKIQHIGGYLRPGPRVPAGINLEKRTERGLKPREGVSTTTCPGGRSFRLSCAAARVGELILVRGVWCISRGGNGCGCDVVAVWMLL